MSVTPPPGGMPWDPTRGAPPPPPATGGPAGMPAPAPSQEPPTLPNAWSDPPRYTAPPPQQPFPQAHPDQPHQPHHPDHPGPPAPRKRRRLVPVLIVVVAVALLAASGYYAVNRWGWPGGDPAPAASASGSAAPTGANPPKNDAIKSTDIANAPVYVRGKLTAFENGKRDDFTLDPKSAVYADLDADGDLDAAASVAVGGDQPWTQILLWLWDGASAKPVAFEASWQWSCAPLPSMSFTAGQGGLSVTRSVSNKCGGDAATETIAVAMSGDFPVEVMGTHHSATTRCRVPGPNATESTDVTGKADPLVFNASGSPVLAQKSEYAKVEVHHRPSPNTTLDNGFAIAQIHWNGSDAVGCGWVPWTAVTG